MSEPCAHERETPYVPAALVADLEAVIARQLAELYTRREQVARVAHLAAELDVKANASKGMSLGERWQRSTLRSTANSIRHALEGPA